MSDQQPIQLADIQRLADTGAPDLTTAIEQLIEQGEPYREEAPEGAIDLNALRASLAQAAKAWDKKQRQQGARDAWQRYLAQNDDMIAPQVRLADLVVKLYERGPADGPARQALLLILREGPLVFGLWGGIKRVYKRAEKDMDAEVFGALAARFDVNASERGGDIGRGTFIYLRRCSDVPIWVDGHAAPRCRSVSSACHAFLDGLTIWGCPWTRPSPNNGHPRRRLQRDARVPTTVRDME